MTGARSWRTVRVVPAVVMALGLVLGACDSSTPAKSVGTPPKATLARCPTTGTGTTVTPKGSTGSGATIGSVSVRPGPVSVLTAVVASESPAPVTLAVVASSRVGSVAVPTTDLAATHEVPVLGLEAATRYDVAVTATNTAGATETVHLRFTSGSLPADMPPVVTAVSEPTRMAPGITLFNTMPWGPPKNATCRPLPNHDSGWIIGVNADGHVVWYYRTTLGIEDVSPTKQGTLLVSVNDVLIREIDMLGNTISELGTRVATDYVKRDVNGHVFASALTKPVAIDSAHHELTQMPNGDLMTISTEVVPLDPQRAKGMCKGAKDADGKPVPDPTAVVADIVTELTTTGGVVHQWPLKNYFDPYAQPGSDMCVPANPIAPPNWFYPKVQGSRDWMHTNAAVLDPTTNTLFVSVRHLDTVLGLRYADDANGKSGDVEWRLSPKGGTLDLTSGSYAYHGHAIEPESGNRVLYFDNGNERPTRSKDAPPYSRAVMYQLDPAAGTATQIWEHRDDTPEGPPIYTSFLGDADLLANGNVLVTYAGAATDAGVFYSRIIEVTPGDNGAHDRVVFDMTLGDRKTNGFTAYRSDRVPSLYFAGVGRSRPPDAPPE